MKPAKVTRVEIKVTMCVEKVVFYLLILALAILGL